MPEYIPVGEDYRYHVLYHAPSNSTRIMLYYRPEGHAAYSPIEVISVRGALRKRFIKTLVEQEIERMGRSD